MLTLAFVAFTGCGGSATRTSSAEASHPAVLALQLRALERKMQRLHVNGERYRQTSHVQIDEHGKRRSLESSTIVEVSLSAAAQRIFSGRTHTPVAVLVGSSLYLYSPDLARADKGRPWVQREAAGTISFPYHWPSGERGEQENGSYAGLINLINTASGRVRVAGAATVDGQRTTKFTAVVDPAKLLGSSQANNPLTLGGGPQDTLIRQLHLRSLPTRLEVFLTESGLPIRVVAAAKLASGSYSDTETTDILAVNPAITVKRPPARQTISRTQFAKLWLSGAIRGVGRPPIRG
jgi:hypothetical protein